MKLSTLGKIIISLNCQELPIFICTKVSMVLTTTQDTVNSGIIISTWLFHINVLSLFIPKNFMLVILDSILLSQPTPMEICELFWAKNCMRLVFPKFSDNKLAWNQLLTLAKTALITFIKLVAFGLVIIRLLYHSWIKQIWIYYCYV